MNNISRYVKDKLSDSTYQKMKSLKNISFKYGRVVYFSEENIDKGQNGYRYNPVKDECIVNWPDDNFVVIGIDNSVGDGGEPIILKTDENNLPVYHFENLDWNQPEKIAESLDDYIRINNMIAQYSEDIEEENLSEADFNYLVNEIKKISNSYYWVGFLTCAMPLDES